jgi:hypothetical protein
MTTKSSVGKDTNTIEGEEQSASGSPQTMADRPIAMSKKARHGLVGDIVDTLEPHTESDPQGLLVQLLVAFGNAIGNGPYFKVEAARHALNLFCCLVGSTAKARKGTGWSHAEQLLDAGDPGWKRDHVKAGLSTGEGLIGAVSDGTESEPAVEDKRLLVVESEFSGMLRIMSRLGNSLSKILRQAWDGEILATMTRHSPLKATGAHISIVGHTTMEELERYCGITEMFSGFANRFLWVYVQRSKLLPLGGAVPDEALRRLKRRLKSSLTFARQVGEITFTREAKALWKQNYPRLTADVSGLVGAVTSRAEAQVRRIAAIYALMDESDQIDEEHLEAALAVWKYCADSAEFVFGRRDAAPPLVRIRQKLLELLRSSPDGLTRTQISTAFDNHHSGELISSILSGLRQRGLVDFRKETTRGRAAERWFAVSSKEQKGENND